MIIDATKISYFKYPERSSYDQPRSRKKKKDAEDKGVIIDASVINKRQRKKSV
jgi:hypothetical protein